jgi:hypothetical protein
MRRVRQGLVRSKGMQHEVGRRHVEAPSARHQGTGDIARASRKQPRLCTQQPIVDRHPHRAASAGRTGAPLTYLSYDAARWLPVRLQDEANNTGSWFNQQHVR